MGVYDWLISGGSGSGNTFDRHVFACALALALADRTRPPATALGLSRADLAQMIAHHFPHAWLVVAGDGEPCAAPEEEDLRALLIEHRTRPSHQGKWLAHIIARRSLEPNHLWQDLGLPGRADLSRMLHAHFAPLAERNARDMKWKKFFYRELCQREGVLICKSPVCDACDDFAHCFGGEDGLSLLAAPAASSVSPRFGGSPC